jgi:hypothetical protein
MDNQAPIEISNKEKKYNMTDALAEVKQSIDDCKYLDTTFFCKKTQRKHRIIHEVLEREYFIDDKGVKWVKLAE